jgi:hypothetical protein
MLINESLAQATLTQPCRDMLAAISAPLTDFGAIVTFGGGETRFVTLKDLHFVDQFGL